MFIKTEKLFVAPVKFNKSLTRCLAESLTRLKIDASTLTNFISVLSRFYNIFIPWIAHGSAQCLYACSHQFWNRWIHFSGFIGHYGNLRKTYV